MAQTKRWSVFKLLLKLVFTSLLGYFVFQKIDFQQVKSIFGKSDPWYILAAALVYFISQVVSSWRLLGFLRCIGLPLRFGFNIRLYMLGMFYNVFLPGGIGGDGYKIYFLRKKFQRPTRKIFLSLLLDRASGLWAICILAFFFMLFIPQFQYWHWWPVLIIISITLIDFIIYKTIFSTYIKNFLPAHGKAILVQSLQLLCVFLILSSQQHSGNLLPYLFSFLLTTVATIVPLSIGGLGIREYVIMNCAIFFGLDETLAVFTTLCFYFLSTLIALPGAWFVFRPGGFDPMPGEDQAKAVENDAEKVIHSHQHIP